MLKLAPSILAADYSRLAEMIGITERAGAHYVHIDVMDGVFVRNKSAFDPSLVRRLRPASNLVFDVHLMTVQPDKYFKDYAEAGADILCFHLEAASDPAQQISKIKELRKKAAVAISPGTPTDAVFPLLDMLDMVLIMSVDPGAGGQELKECTLKKALCVREYITAHSLNCDVEMDGGIRLPNAESVINAGVNVLVSGTDIFKAEGIADRVGEYLEMFRVNRI
ncbi:MAG: ribulose-phosphate 3-epimerase [Clostridiales bacterium]|nr:ribulose-phosphate 3-epimerase [Clostridiales bacterium]